MRDLSYRLPLPIRGITCEFDCDAPLASPQRRACSQYLYEIMVMVRGVGRHMTEVLQRS